jgi:glycosyltransferase involved in cell wall biosynthesis
VIPNGLDDVQQPCDNEINEYLRNLDLKDKKFILSVGRVTVDKGFDTLIKAFKEIGENDVHLVIVGGISEKEYWNDLLKLANDRVHLLGRIPREELKYLYASCCLYVNSSYFEGLSNAILEAVSFECPIVASDIIANREMELKETSFYCAGDVSELRKKILDGLLNPRQYVADRSEFPSWESVAEKLEYAYSEVAPHINGKHG